MRKIVRLTESDLHRIIKESVNRIIKESDYMILMIVRLYHLLKIEISKLLS